MTKSEKVEPLTNICKQQMIAILKEMVLDFRDLDQARLSLESSSDFLLKNLFSILLSKPHN